MPPPIPTLKKTRSTTHLFPLATSSKNPSKNDLSTKLIPTPFPSPSTPAAFPTPSPNPPTVALAPTGGPSPILLIRLRLANAAGLPWTLFFSGSGLTGLLIPDVATRGVPGGIPAIPAIPAIPTAAAAVVAAAVAVLVAGLLNSDSSAAFWSEGSDPRRPNAGAGVCWTGVGTVAAWRMSGDEGRGACAA